MRIAVAVTLPKGASQPAGNYIKGYMQAAGWSVHRVTFEKFYVSFFVSKATFMASKNL